MASYKVGDTVTCRLFNKPEGKFYGESFTGIVKEVKPGEDKPYLVQRLSNLPPIWLHAKEVKRFPALK